jgi:hypothetical protein
MENVMRDLDFNRGLERFTTPEKQKGPHDAALYLSIAADAGYYFT